MRALPPVMVDLDNSFTAVRTLNVSPGELVVLTSAEPAEQWHIRSEAPTVVAVIPGETEEAIPHIGD